MRAFIKLVSVLTALAFPAAVAHAEDASVLLRLYGATVFDPAAEEERLHRLEEQYEWDVRDVSGRSMFDTAQTLERAYDHDRLAEADRIIYALTDRLDALEAEMVRESGAEIGTIMRLDAEYRDAAGLLRRNREDRKAIAGEAQPISVRDAELAGDKRKLDDLRRDVERQRERVNTATEYAELGDVAGFRSPLAIPVRITSPFGDRLDPVTRDEITFHAGLDMEAPIGTQVLSAFHGTIAKTGESEELGLYVWVDHGNGIRTLYGHLSSVSAVEGQAVRQYEPIALSGNTGNRTTGEHLHFAVAVHGTAVDPAAFVKESR